MSHPFEDDEAEYLVLANEQGQHSLWPVSAAVPAGWQVVAGPTTRHACLDYVESHGDRLQVGRRADGGNRWPA